VAVALLSQLATLHTAYEVAPRVRVRVWVTAAVRVTLTL